MGLEVEHRGRLGDAQHEGLQRSGSWCSSSSGPQPARSAARSTAVGIQPSSSAASSGRSRSSAAPSNHAEDQVNHSRTQPTIPPRVSRASDPTTSSAWSSLLHQVIARDWPSFSERAELEGGLPEFIVDEFEAHLRCGILEHGLAVLACRQCGESMVVSIVLGPANVRCRRGPRRRGLADGANIGTRSSPAERPSLPSRFSCGCCRRSTLATASSSRPASLRAKDAFYSAHRRHARAVMLLVSWALDVRAPVLVGERASDAPEFERGAVARRQARGRLDRGGRLSHGLTTVNNQPDVAGRSVA